MGSQSTTTCRVSPADNETGWWMALDKLAAFVEAGQNK
jgi:hypothetical protein